ncbi:uncharacterized protein LOC128305176 [Anopheles moucheti]|uniref:uncharacterized protein LOC128305176 n=1 Tax=Anopheles moucheti TaxID=186751 RepID=UPI0022F10495|nr:uncharacterized protein LOC128305176 [Anopheles moucheti]
MPNFGQQGQGPVHKAGDHVANFFHSTFIRSLKCTDPSRIRMKSLALLCTLVLFAIAKDAFAIEPIGKMRPTERLMDNLDVLQEDSNFDPLAPVSEHSALFDIAKRLAQKKESSIEGREAYSGGYHPGGELNNLDRLELYTKQFLDLAVDVSYSSVYLLSNYTRFVRNADNKYIIVFE